MFNETQMDTLEWEVMQILNAKKELIINMYNKGISLDIISECTNLSVDEINNIIKNIK